MEQWLSLTDYASKHRVSVSTLRRRIKNDKIEYRQESGKYFVRDQKVSTIGFEKVPLKAKVKSTVSTPINRAPVQSTSMDGQSVDSSDFSFDTPIEHESILHHDASEMVTSQGPVVSEDHVTADQGKDQEDNSFLSTKILLDEIKKAYMSVLQEKEEQLVALKTEVADLKTLVRALESENNRLQGLLVSKDDLDSF